MNISVAVEVVLVDLVTLGDVIHVRTNLCVKWPQAQNLYKRGRLGTVDLLVLLSLDQLLFILPALFTFLQNKLP